MKNLKIIFISTALLIVSCKSGVKKNSSKRENYLDKKTIDSNISSVQNLSETLKKAAKSNFELNVLFIKNDTLELVSDSQFLYFPFGVFKNIQSLKHSLNQFRDSIQKDSSSNEELERMIFNKSFVKFYYDKDQGKFQIVSGQIIDENIVMINGIKLGMEKHEFLEEFFNFYKPIKVDNIKVIQLVSGLQGMTHYYYFNNDSKLVSIKLMSDYLFNKE